MAVVTSLGLHQPSAVPYLVQEQVPISEHIGNDYDWSFHSARRGGQQCDDELVITKTRVVWSRGGLVRKSFDFEVEGEPVTRALFTTFRSDLAGRRARDPDARERLGRQESLAPEQALPTAGRHDDASVDNAEALVIFLKSQAHVYFLSGTSHVLHLPFEVEGVFSMPAGLLIQRKLHVERMVSLSMKFPRAPPNSFAFSQPQTWSASSSVQSTFSVATLGSPQQLALPPTALLGDLWHETDTTDDSGWPRTFSLTDPLSEMGIVMADEKMAGQRHAARDGILDPAEEVLHITDPYSVSDSMQNSAERLVLVVTMNRTTSMYTVWQLSHVLQDDTARRQWPGGTSVRRRSSFRPATGTLATTHIPTGHTFHQEALDSADRKSNDLQTKSRPEKPRDFIASLDPELQNEGTPRRKSRRVSSMLARADLSTSHDNFLFPEIAASQNPSFKRADDGTGSRYNRVSLGTGSTANERLSLASQRSVSSVGFLEPPVEELLDELNAGGDFGGFHKMGLVDEHYEGLKKEVLLMRVGSIPLEQTTIRYDPDAKQSEARCHIFSMMAPPTASEDPRKSQVVLCIHEVSEHRLLVLKLDVQCLRTEKHPRRKRGHQEHSPRSCSVYIESHVRADHVLDACKLTDGLTCRIAILVDQSGTGQLSLQAPWSTMIDLRLPKNYRRRNKCTLGHKFSLRGGHEGGLKRLLSQRPRAIASLRSPSEQGHVDLLDKDGRLHRIQVRMEARNPMVRGMIEVCRSALPGDRGGEAIAVAWWKAYQWLHDLSVTEPDVEFNALVVVLFTMVLSLDEGKRYQATQRSPTRTGGSVLKRGENWQKILTDQSPIAQSAPQWSMDSAWDWLDISDSRHFVHQKHSCFHKQIDLTARFLHSPLGIAATSDSGYLPTATGRSQETRWNAMSDVMSGLHLLNEELRLDVSTADPQATSLGIAKLSLLLAQLSRWTGWRKWANYHDANNIELGTPLFDEAQFVQIPEPAEPPDVLGWVEKTLSTRQVQPFVSIADITASRSSLNHLASPHSQQWSLLTPRTGMLHRLFSALEQASTAVSIVEAMHAAGINQHILDTLPEAIILPLQESIAACQIEPPTTWSNDLLSLIDREDVQLLRSMRKPVPVAYHTPLVTCSPLALVCADVQVPTHQASADVHLCTSGAHEPDSSGAFDASAEMDRQSITKLIFNEDRRFDEAAKILDTSKPTPAQYAGEPDWTESDLLEAQKDHVQMLATRTLAIPTGRGLLYFSARVPLLTEKFPIGGFNLHCVMKPSNNTVGVDKNAFTEEKVCWAFFHAGVSAGLSISRDTKGIDTSWILYNKPSELSNRHAGFLLALGLNGHLKNIAKWVAFKYLTPKHTMTSIGLLLGLAASYLGKMDSLITRLLSVHVTRMLPPGAAELNLSPLTQTAGIMGIGLLYCGTEHRRMSEIMLSEIEHADPELEDEPLRDEGYRLASGFSLGLINLAKGADLKGLHDLLVTERLIRLATDSRRVNLVHILDKATSAAIVAIILMFMKSEDVALARKIDVPDSTLQYDYVRPDAFLLRTLAKHLILWSKIEATTAWVEQQLPNVYQKRNGLTNIHKLTSDDLPFYDILAGVLFALALRHAGSGSIQVRDLLLRYLDQILRISKLPATTYDEKLTRTTTRNCLDLLALSVATAMAGSGDLAVFRRLRALHGRDDANTPYGSHFAAHLAMGALFLGGGTHTFGTSNLAIASLIIAFYPLFPTTILDNKSHLQAFRHFWVLAAEARCLVARDIDTNQPVALPLSILQTSGALTKCSAPCLLPELHLLNLVQTSSNEYWNVALDFERDVNVKDKFLHNQNIWVRRNQAGVVNQAVFQTSLQAFGNLDRSQPDQVMQWIFDLPALKSLTRVERSIVEDLESSSSTNALSIRTTVVDIRIMLAEASLTSGKRDRLQGLKLLFAWKEELEKRKAQTVWLSGAVIDRLMANVWLLGAAASE